MLLKSSPFDVQRYCFCRGPAAFQERWREPLFLEQGRLGCVRLILYRTSLCAATLKTAWWQVQLPHPEVIAFSLHPFLDTFRCNTLECVTEAHSSCIMSTWERRGSQLAGEHTRRCGGGKAWAMSAHGKEAIIFIWGIVFSTALSQRLACIPYSQIYFNSVVCPGKVHTVLLRALKAPRRAVANTVRICAESQLICACVVIGGNRCSCCSLSLR